MIDDCKTFYGIPVEEARIIIDHYKNTGERLTEQYVNGYIAGFNDCLKQFEENFLRHDFDGALSVEFKKFDGSYRLKKTSDKASDKEEGQDEID